MRFGLALVVVALGCGGDDSASAPSDAGGGADADARPGTDAATDAGPTDAPLTDAPTPSSSRWVMGYYAGYEAAQYPTSAIGWNGLTHLAVAFYLPDGMGGLSEDLFGDATSGPKLGHALVDAAHAHGKKALASIGGGGEHDAMVASMQAGTSDAFVARIVKLVGDYGYDGVDLDWEPITGTDPDLLVTLATRLKKAIPSLILTIPIGTLNHNLGEDLSYYPKLAPLFDQLNMMSYGMAGAYSGWKSWHSSPLHWNMDTATPTGIDDSADALLAAGVPAGKLGVGSGFYGLCYSSPVTAPAQALGGSMIVADDGTMSYAHIVGAYDPSSSRTWDSQAMVPYLSFSSPHGPEKCTYVTYEDAQAIAAKGDYVKTKKLGGAIIWTINQGYVASAPSGMQNPLLDAMETAFLK